MDWSRLTIGLGAALAFGLGAFRVSTTEGNADGYALLAVSMILVGVSLTLELHEKWHRDRGCAFDGHQEWIAEETKEP